MVSHNTSSSWLNRPILIDTAKLFTWENLIIFLILALAIVSRFALLGERVMSHDEVNHVVPSYELYQGHGYTHDPVTHGPFQFHAIALSYFLFGDSDFTSRVPAALFSVSAVAFVLFAFRRYLGHTGALIAGLLFLISPFLLFYGRYTRNEAFIELVGVVMIYAILRYLERGDRFSLFLLTASIALHFTIKETAFIYTAQALIFLVFMFLVEVRRIQFRSPARYNRFLLLLSGALLLVIGALGLSIVKASKATGAAVTTTPAVGPTVSPSLFSPANFLMAGEAIALLIALILGLIAIFSLAKDIGWKQIRHIRSFSLLILISTLILPMLSPFPVKMLGWNPLDYSSSLNIGRTAIFVVLFFIIAVVIGWWWNPRLWLQNAFLFYAIFTVFYTTFFTNGFGFFTGIVGSLGYWLSQQGVERGSQPLYYYALIQVPIYEFLAASGTLLAAYYGLRYSRFFTIPGFAPAVSPRVPQLAEDQAPVEEFPDYPADVPAFIPKTSHSDGEDAAELEDQSSDNEASMPDLRDMYAFKRPLPVLLLLLFWSLTSLIAYSVAGERMPWLTVHIALPILLTAGWGLGFLVDTIDWKRIANMSGLLALLLLPVFLASTANTFGVVLGTQPPFQGNTLEQLQATSQFIVSVIAAIASGVGILYLLRDWRLSQTFSLAGVALFGLMAVLTARTAYRASFINYDYPFEYLIYAHAARGPKDVLAQVQEISRRITGGKDIKVAYSNDGLYPYWWYLRDYPNHYWYQDSPTRELRDYPLIIAGEDVFGKIDPIVANNYIEYDYMRLWWPNQDYFNLTWDRILGAIKDPQMRAAIFDIWLNRDYTQYARLTGKEKEFSLENWSPGARMRLYIRKDIVAQIWNYGASPAVANPEEIDPYASKITDLQPVQVIGAPGAQPGLFDAPRGITVAQDSTLYVADSKNNRIQHLSPNGDVLQLWGTFADQSAGNAPGGTFNEPWDVAVGPDGSVYVSDTWNHRIQKFTSDGQFIKMWGYFGQAEQPEAFWGPRGLAVDKQGRVYVMDTGNDRVVIFDADGNFITQFGSQGFDKGQMDEPVGIAIDPSNGDLFITDTWNQRVQEFSPSANGQIFTPIRSWDIKGWVGQLLDNKPFIAISPVNGHVFVTDPEASRVLEFDQEGNFVYGWGKYSTGPDGIGLASGVAVADDGSVWVSDGANSALLRFQPPLTQ